MKKLIKSVTNHSIVWVQTQMAVVKRDAAVVHPFLTTSLAWILMAPQIFCHSLQPCNSSRAKSPVFKKFINV